VLGNILWLDELRFQIFAALYKFPSNKLNEVLSKAKSLFIGKIRLRRKGYDFPNGILRIVVECVKVSDLDKMIYVAYTK